MISAGLARLFGAANAERDVVVELIKAESHGDAQSVISMIEGCREEPACQRRVRATIRQVSSPHKVRLLRLDGPARLSTGGRTGTARVVWQAGSRDPIAQCLRMRRGGNVLKGFRVTILELGEPLSVRSTCE